MSETVAPLCRVCQQEKDEWCGRCLNAPVHKPHQEYLFRPTENGCISYHEYEPQRRPRVPNPTEAEAREAVLKAYDDSGESPTFETDEVCDAAFLATIDAYAEAVRATEREKYEVLVTAVRADHWDRTDATFEAVTEALAWLDSGKEAESA